MTFGISFSIDPSRNWRRFLSISKCNCLQNKYIYVKIYASHYIFQDTDFGVQFPSRFSFDFLLGSLILFFLINTFSDFGVRVKRFLCVLCVCGRMVPFNSLQIKKNTRICLLVSFKSFFSLKWSHFYGIHYFIPYFFFFFWFDHGETFIHLYY